MAERPRAIAQDALQPERHRNTPLPQEGVTVVASEAQRNGVVAGAATAALFSGAVYYAHTTSRWFRGALGISGKAALVVTPAAGAFFLRSTQTVHEARADPDGFVAGKQQDAPQAQPQYQLTTWQKAANMVYYHPFKVIGSIAAPLYGLIFYIESTNPSTASMPLSQRIIHTRVYGQAIAVLTACSVMGFVKSMEDNGEYRIEDGRVVRGLVANAHLRQYYEAVSLPPPGERSPQSAEAARRQQQAAEQLAAEQQAAEQQQGFGWELIVPLLYAPVVPLMRVGLRNRVPPERLTQMTLGVIAVGLAHAGSIMFSDSSVAYRR